MVFGIDPIKMAKKEALKVDFDKDSVPDVIEALDAGEAATTWLAGALSVLEEEEYVEIFDLLPEKVKAKLALKGIDAANFGRACAVLPQALRTANAVLEKVEAELSQ